MKTVRQTILEKLEDTQTLAAFKKGGDKEFQYYWNYAQYSQTTMSAHFRKLGVPEGNSIHDTHNAYCAWGTK